MKTAWGPFNFRTFRDEARRADPCADCRYTTYVTYEVAVPVWGFFWWLRLESRFFGWAITRVFYFAQLATLLNTNSSSSFLIGTHEPFHHHCIFDIPMPKFHQKC